MLIMYKKIVKAHILYFLASCDQSYSGTQQDDCDGY